MSHPTLPDAQRPRLETLEEGENPDDDGRGRKKDKKDDKKSPARRGSSAGQGSPAAKKPSSARGVRWNIT